MSAIPPPPVDLSATSVRADNDEAIARLRTTPARSGRTSVLALLGFLGATVAAGAVSAIVHRRTRNKLWYRTLRKPRFTAAPIVYPFVWAGLHAAAAYSVWRVWRSPDSTARTAALGLWGAQLALNAAWSPLFFGAHRPKLALADLAGNYATLGAYALSAASIDRPAGALVTPYLGWLTYGAASNVGIIRKNAWRF